MAGLGFVLFIIPVMVGILLGILFCFIRPLRFLASYSLCIPLFGVAGAIGGENLGMYISKPYDYGLTHAWLPKHAFLLGLVLGYALGMSAGALVAFGVNRAQRGSLPTSDIHA